MTYNFAKLRGRIVERFNTCYAFAKAVGISRCHFSRILNGFAYFTPDQIYECAKALEIPTEEIGSYFFCR